MANDATGSAQSGSEGSQDNLDTSRIPGHTLDRLDEQAGGDLDAFLNGVREWNARKDQQ